jgi:hypothetical protein
MGSKKILVTTEFMNSVARLLKAIDDDDKIDIALSADIVSKLMLEKVEAMERREAWIRAQEE